MAMIACYECSSEMSNKASACPRCGAPNHAERKRAETKARSAKQNQGCLLVLIGIPLGLALPPVGAVFFIVGLVYLAANTKLW